MQVKTRIGQLSVEEANKRYVVRMENGVALVMGASKKGYDELMKDIEAGKFDEYAKILDKAKK